MYYEKIKMSSMNSKNNNVNSCITKPYTIFDEICNLVLYRCDKPIYIKIKNSDKNAVTIPININIQTMNF